MHKATSTDALEAREPTTFLNLEGEEVPLDEFNLSIDPEAARDAARARQEAVIQQRIQDRAQQIQALRDAGQSSGTYDFADPQDAAVLQLFGVNPPGVDVPTALQHGFLSIEEATTGEQTESIDRAGEQAFALAEQSRSILLRRQEIARLREDQRVRFNTDLERFRTEVSTERGRIESLLTEFGGTAEQIEQRADLQIEGATTAQEIARETGQRRLKRLRKAGFKPDFTAGRPD